MFRFIMNIIKNLKKEKKKEQSTNGVQKIIDGDLEIKIDKEKGTCEIISERKLSNDEIIQILRKYM